MACSASLSSSSSSLPIWLQPRHAAAAATALGPCVIRTQPGKPRPRALTVRAAAADFSSVDGTTIAVIGGSSVAALAAVLTLTDPDRRRKVQAEEVGGDDKEVVREYFNSTGFQRWKKIYGETDDVNRVQLDIRLGHSKTVENVLKMLKDEGPLQGLTVCDAGCGTGSLSIPLAKEGAVVFASDISAAMVSEAQQQVAQHNYLPNSPPTP